jgi:spermidine synthase
MNYPFTSKTLSHTASLRQIASVDTGHQRVDIYDVLRPQVQTLESYKRSLRNDDSYESQNPASFQPDRIVFIDGVLQSRRFGEVAYHESFVHPAMFAHKHPGRVAVIGGGDGAILREVLKHSTVKEVVFIEKDDKIINLTKEHVPEYSDCGSLLGVTKNCYDDPRVQIVHLDLKKWLTERFSGKGEEMEEAFDVIIMDEM